MSDDGYATSPGAAAGHPMDLENLALGQIETTCLGAAYRDGRHGEARGKITDKRTKEHECDVALRVDLLEGTLYVEKFTPRGEPISTTTIDLFLTYE